MSEYELELIRQGGHWGDLENFKRAVAAISPFYDFAAYNGMAARERLYTSALHAVRRGESFFVLRLSSKLISVSRAPRMAAVLYSVLSVRSSRSMPSFSTVSFITSV